jgi:hypothetical protein
MAPPPTFRPLFPTNDEILTTVAEGASVQDWPVQPPPLEYNATSKQCGITRNDMTPPTCDHGDPNGNQTALIYGDSHAAMWTPAFDVIGRQTNWRVVQVSKQGCQVPDFPRYTEPLKREYTECADFRKFALNTIDELHPDVVIITSAFENVRHMVDGEPTRDGIEEAWDEGLASMINRIKPHTDRVVVLGDIPYANEPGIDCLSANSNDVQACNTPYADGVDSEHNERERAVAEQNGAEYVDGIPWFCTIEVCPAVISELTTHHDNYHAVDNYVVWLSEALGQVTGLLPEVAVLAPLRVN